MNEANIRLLANGVVSICDALECQLDDLLFDMETIGILTQTQCDAVSAYVANT